MKYNTLETTTGTRLVYFSDNEENLPEEIDLGQADGESFDEAQISMGEEKELEITFYPPLYIQRYEKVLEFLFEERWVHAISRVVIQSYFYWRYGRICLM